MVANVRFFVATRENIQFITNIYTSNKKPFFFRNKKKTKRTALGLLYIKKSFYSRRNEIKDYYLKIYNNRGLNTNTEIKVFVRIRNKAGKTISYIKPLILF